MKKLILLLLFTQLLFSQETRYEFLYRDNRTPAGWDRVEMSGEVIFYESKNINTVTIITSESYQYYYIKSKQLFIRQATYLYTLVDDNDNQCSIIVAVKGTLDTVELSYYSNRIGEKYYRLMLKKCE
jgi:hypothetical protein